MWLGFKFAQFQVVFLASCLVAMSGCSPSAKAPVFPVSQNNNGQPVPGDKPSAGDVGGGATLYSSEEQVKKVLAHAWEDLSIYLSKYMIQSAFVPTDRIPDVGSASASKPDVDYVYKKINKLSKKIIATYQSSEKRAAQLDGDSQRLSKIKRQAYLRYLYKEDYYFPKRAEKSLSHQYRDDSDRVFFFNDLISRKVTSQDEEVHAYFEQGWQILIEHIQSFSKLNLRSDCKKPEELESHKAAWVSTHALGAELCFDLQMLRKIPSTTLKYQMLSLLAHEFAHVLGFDEEFSHILQIHFYEYLMIWIAKEEQANLGKLLIDMNPASSAMIWKPALFQVAGVKFADVINGKNHDLLNLSECYELGAGFIQFSNSLNSLPKLMVYHQRYGDLDHIVIMNPLSVSLEQAWTLYDGLLRVYDKVYQPLTIYCQSTAKMSASEDEKNQWIEYLPEQAIADKSFYEQFMQEMLDITLRIFPKEWFVFDEPTVEEVIPDNPQ